MSDFEELVNVSVQIIANVGSARSLYIEAIDAAKKGEFDEAQRLVGEGREFFNKGHDAHMGLVQQEASGSPTAVCLLLAHAEDQLMSAESFGILADEFIDVHRRLKELEG